MSRIYGTMQKPFKSIEAVVDFRRREHVMWVTSIKAYRGDQEITKRNFDWKDLIQKSHFFEKKFGFGIVSSESCSVAMDHG